MLLAIDVGNTNIVAGAFQGDKLASHWRLATDVRQTADEYAVWFDQLFRLSSLDPTKIQGVVICSVVPTAQATICAAIRKYWKLEPLVISLNLDLGLCIQYEPLQAVGMDRIANAVAAIERFGSPVVVVDFGTATTIDAISGDGVYIGGAIAPGLEISAEALYAQTSQLPRVALESPQHAIGTSTAMSLQSGILFGYAGLVDGLVGRFRAELGPDVRIVATGGLATTVSPFARCVEHVDPDLTLFGLRLLYVRNSTHAD